MLKYFLSGMVCVFLLNLIIIMSGRYNIIKVDGGDRWSNRPVPCFGGIAVMVSLSWFIFTGGHLVFLCTLVLFCLGLLDDATGIEFVFPKLVIQIVVAVITIWFGGYRLHWFSYIYLDWFVTGIWIVGLINSFNLIDNMDGQLAIVGVVSSFAFGFAFFPYKMTLPFVIPFMLILFLLYNFPKAEIWMGDCGSLPLGYLFAVMGLSYYGITESFSMIPILILLFPILDTTFVFTTRILKGKKFYVGGRDHLSHELIEFVGSERRVFLLVMGFQIASGVIALCLKN